MRLHTYGQNEILHGHLHFDPFFVTERRPNEVRLCNSRLVWVKNDFALLVVHMQAAKKQDKTGECRIAGDRLQPVVCKASGQTRQLLVRDVFNSP